MFVKLTFVVLIANAPTEYYGFNNETHFEGKIVGGDLSNNDNFPHAVFIHICVLPDKEFCGFCGSSVLNQRLLITVAHCVENTKDIAVDARAGATDILKATILQDILYFVYHEHYSNEDIFGDIALLMLAEDLPLGKNVKRIILAPYFFAGIEGKVAGWGSISENHDKITLLKSVKQKVWNTSDCNKYEMIPRGTFCANSGKTSNNYPFHGDSGSGFVINDHELIGLVSYRADDDRPDLITYTNVSYYSRWVYRSARLLYTHCNNVRTGAAISTRITTSTPVY